MCVLLFVLVYMVVVEILSGKFVKFCKPVYCIKLQVRRFGVVVIMMYDRSPKNVKKCSSRKKLVVGYATKSSGRLKPPLRFIYWRYLRLRITCTSPTSLPSTFLFLVVSNVQKPIVFSISTSSGDLPSRSASLICGRSAAAAAPELLRVARRDVDGPEPRERDL